MINTVFEYDHILMRAEYRTPDLHRHLAVRLILANTQMRFVNTAFRAENVCAEKS